MAWALVTSVQVQIQWFPANVNTTAVYKAIADDGVAIIEGFLSLDQWLHNIVGFSKVFRDDVLNHELMHGICRRAFETVGDYWMGYGSVIENGPGREAQPWHRDQPNHPLLNTGPGSPEAMLNFFTVLMDFTRETGVTEFMWNTHQRVELGEPDADHPVVWSALQASDTAVLSGKMVHQGSANQSDSYRRALLVLMIPGLLTLFDATCHLLWMVGRRSIQILFSELAIWCLDMREVGEQIGLKSNQPDKEKEKE
ncbi:hypothetical protein BDV28DRAFT_161054 [Aspergillus coremiiformis]|uniref:Phytanoyl-CoA dioxygenase n=1 Tax=Aspergillus coremiiformis TaxID=138285 RepID=A0A5N6YTG3_9EURO|nr:hypothetical protein BDV28DRAFT_161054 [Aspergillus coremiiformis]